MPLLAGCDRCGCKGAPEGFFDLIGNSLGDADRFDLGMLCLPCLEDFEAWMKVKPVPERGAAYG